MSFHLPRRVGPPGRYPAEGAYRGDRPGRVRTRLWRKVRICPHAVEYGTSCRRCVQEAAPYGPQLMDVKKSWHIPVGVYRVRQAVETSGFSEFWVGLQVLEAGAHCAPLQRPYSAPVASLQRLCTILANFRGLFSLYAFPLPDILQPGGCRQARSRAVLGFICGVARTWYPWIAPCPPFSAGPWTFRCPRSPGRRAPGPGRGSG